MAFEGKSNIIEITPTISTSIYADLDQLGDVKKLTNALDVSSDTGVVMSVIVIDKAKQNASLDLLLFDEEPTVTSTDNAKLDIPDSEMVDKYLGRISIDTTDYVELNG
jgi:hypothetical protein